MQRIQVLDQITIDKIAAGEVIERPASVVKELVENAIDAGASSIMVEIEDGGISLIRIIDNGSGILREDIRNAFLRHSTSKIRSADDLMHISSLGFRGEALSSIAAVTKVELLTKTREEVFGSRYLIEGGKEISLEDAGAADGTTFMVRQLFYNVPARRKFLRTAMTEAGHVQDLLIRLALSHPDVAFLFKTNGQEKLRTSGSGKLKEVIYSIYGREIAANLLEVDYEKNGIYISGFIGKPVIVRGNRNFETFFINGRYIRNSIISKALEDAFKDFMMQHKFPFAVLHFQVDPETVDVNVHPTKMELRFQKQQQVYDIVFECVHRRLLEPELIPQASVGNDDVTAGKNVPSGREESPFLLRSRKRNPDTMPSVQPSFFTDKKREEKQAETREEKTELKKTEIQAGVGKESKDDKDGKEGMPPDKEESPEEYYIRKMRERVLSYHNRSSAAEVSDRGQIFRGEAQKDRIQDRVREAGDYRMKKNAVTSSENKKDLSSVVREEPSSTAQIEISGQNGGQMNLFEDKFLKRDIRAEYRLIGQVFDTYWLVEFKENLYIIDQHAAHERVLYEQTLKNLKTREYTSQYISPPIILQLTMQEEESLKNHMEHFQRIGYEIEPFGGDSYAVRAVPGNLFSIAKKDLLLEILDALSDGLETSMTPDVIDEKIASISCKAAVKGNQRLSAREVDTLIGELLLLENPYHCPHGRPTIIAISKREMEKKFKRIV